MAEANKKRQMTERELLALIGQYEKSALGASVSMGPTVGGQLTPAGQKLNTLEIDRYNALNAYFGRPMGNEVADRSQIVLPELRDTVEWIMPQLMRMFAATSKVCQFDAETPADETQADIETDVVNALFMKENNGFFILHDYFKDALLLRNGYVKVYWQEEKKSTVENYTGLSENEVTELMQPDDESKIEVLEQREYGLQVMTAMGQMEVGGISKFDIKLRRTSVVGRVKVECVPPEEILVSPKARHNFEDCPFVEHKTKTTKSGLKEQGFDTSKIDTIGNGSPDWMNLVALARNEVTDQLGETAPSDAASEDCDLREVYIRVDFDGDGVAELRRVMIGGDKILENEECEEIPVAYCSPVRMPHRHVGISFYDLLNDLQVIKTTLFRQALDNLYISNNQRTAVNYNNVNLDDLLTSRPGGVVRVNGIPQENVMPMSSDGLMMQQVIPALEYVDGMREMRTGIGKDTMGVDADALQDVTKGGQLAAMSAAALKVELVARLLAEGVKDIFVKMHSTLIRHQDKKLTVQLTGKWIDVNPTEWRERTKVSINVGLGSGNREEARGNMMLLYKLQGQMAQFGLVGPKQAFESYKEGVRILGYENPERFVLDPDSPEYQQILAQRANQPQQVAPQVQVANINQQTELQSKQIDRQIAESRANSEQAQQLTQLRKELLEAQAELQHAAMQSGHDHANDQTQTLIKVLGQILAAQLKSQPQWNAGQMLAQDFDQTRGIV